MYVEKPEAALQFVIALKKRSALVSLAEVVIAPPYTLLPQLHAAFAHTKNVRLGAQAVSTHADGAHTGEISGGMLKALGVSVVIIGHSERRLSGETEELVRGQIVVAHKNKMSVVLCVGERERDQQGTHFGIIETQITEALKDAPTGKLLIAYEPVWAIGKSALDAMKPADLQEMVIFIRKVLTDKLGRPVAAKVPILYGGSVEGVNAKELLHTGGVSGFLIGHASAEAHSFLEILTAVK